MFNRLLQWIKDKNRQRRESLLYEKDVIVRFDEIGVSVSWPNGDIHQMNWNLIESIAIETNDSGPWGTDFWWLLEGDGRTCAYPGGATGDIDCLAELERRFTGFSDEQVILANGCTSNARFLCCERTDEA